MSDQPAPAAAAAPIGAAMPENRDTPQGFAFAVTAYLLWGVLPFYMKALAHVPAAEVIAHRIIWSIPVAGIVLLILGRTRELRAALRDPRTLAMGFLTAAVISINWGTYVWAIANDHALDAALGYYINPLFSVALGALFLKERLSRAQMLAVALAVAAVAVLTWEAGRLPLVAVILTTTWGFYAFFRKTLPVGPNQGFMLEVIILSPFAFAYMAWLTATGQSHFAVGVPLDTALLVGCGLVTAGPLMIYANGAKLLRLSTIGVLQYIAPTMIFLIAVFIFDEPFSIGKTIAFPMIWAALVLYTGSMLHGARAGHRAKAAQKLADKAAQTPAL